MNHLGVSNGARYSLVKLIFVSLFPSRNYYLSFFRIILNAGLLQNKNTKARRTYRQNTLLEHNILHSSLSDSSPSHSQCILRSVPRSNTNFGHVKIMAMFFGWISRHCKTVLVRPPSVPFSWLNESLEPEYRLTGEFLCERRLRRFYLEYLSRNVSSYVGETRLVA